MMLMCSSCLSLQALHTLQEAPRVVSVGSWVYISRVCVGGWATGTEASGNPEVSRLLVCWGGPLTFLLIVWEAEDIFIRAWTSPPEAVLSISPLVPRLQGTGWTFKGMGS